MEAECAELIKHLELSNRRVRDLHESLAASSSSQASLDSDVDDEMYVYLAHLGYVMNS